MSTDQKRALLFVNGVVDDYERLRHWFRPGDYVICADGGTRHALALDLRPDAVVGDMDSADPSLLAHWQHMGTKLVSHPTTKDQTDLELALEFAGGKGITDVLLLGAMGGRTDQMLGNLFILAQRAWPLRITLVAAGQAAQIVDECAPFQLDASIGTTVSALPLSPQVSGITYRGLAYPLEGAILEFGSTRGISNFVASSPITIRVQAGKLMVIWSL